MPCSRAYCAATILPSMPRLPKPPGTRMASKRVSCAAVSWVSDSASTYSISTLAWLWMPAWRSASLSDLYESDRSVYLPHMRDLHRGLRMLDLVDQGVPAPQVGGAGQQLQLHADQLVQALLVQQARHLVDRVDVPHADHAVRLHVGEQADLLALVVGDRAVGAAQQHVGLDADLAQLLHRVLGRLGLELAGGGDPGHVGQVHERGVRRAHLQAHLAHRFEERQALDVAHRAADLDDRDVEMVGGTALDELLDLVGDMRDHLHRLAQVVAAALLLEHALVDLAGGEVVGLASSAS